MSTITNKLFPTWIYEKESPLSYEKYDKNSSVTVRSPVSFTRDEIAAINKALATQNQIEQAYITDDFINRLHVFGEKLHCPVIESVTAKDATMWAAEHNCVKLFVRVPKGDDKYYNAADNSSSVQILNEIHSYRRYIESKNPCNRDLELIRWLHENDDGDRTNKDYYDRSKHLDIIGCIDKLRQREVRCD